MSGGWREALVASALLSCAPACSRPAQDASTRSPDAQAAPAAQVRDEAQRRARAAAAELGSSLRALLREQLDASGPAAAVDFCRAEAPRVAAQVSARHGARVGRTALRVRSSTNAPSAWQTDVLERFAAEVAAGRAPESLESAEVHQGTLRWARGLRTEAVCTLCHGTALPADVTAAVQRSYPGDRATGFAEGDLRGLIWVEVALGETRP